jgi:DNA-directed RNA polymerase subunit omega
MNAELVKKALAVVINPNILVNLVSQRVRQLNSGGGRISRPLVADVGNLGAADIALREIAEGAMGYEMSDIIPLTRPSGKGRKRPQHWAKLPTA